MVHLKDAALIVLCITLYGSATFFKRMGLLSLHPYQFLMLTGICYFASIPLWLWLLSNQPVPLTYAPQGVLYVAIYTIFSLAAGVILAFLLQKASSPGSLIVMTNLSSLVTLLLCYLFLQEQLTPQKMVAVALAIVSLVLMNW